MEQEILERVKKIVAEQFGADENDLDASTGFEKDLSADSLDIVELTMSLEDEFGLGELEDEVLENLRTIGDVVSLISSKQQ